MNTSENILAKRKERKLLKKMRKNPNQFQEESYPELTWLQYIFSTDVLENVMKFSDIFTKRQLALTCKKFYHNNTLFFKTFQQKVLNVPKEVFLGCKVKHIVTTIRPNRIESLELITCKGNKETLLMKDIKPSKRRSYFDYYIYDISDKFPNRIFTDVIINKYSYSCTKYSINLFEKSERRILKHRADAVVKGIEFPNGKRRVSVIDDSKNMIKHTADSHIHYTFDGTRDEYESHRVIVTTGQLIFRF